MLTNLLLFVFSIAALIIVHELGHFLALRLLKVDVEEFGLGFPPRAKTLFTWQGTMFSLNWIPLGGFVRPKGDNNPDIPGGLAAASPWVRIAVYLAGPLANVLAAIALFSLLFYQLGAPILDRVQVILVSEGSPAEQAGLLPGDEILAVDGEPIDSTEKLIALVGAKPNQEIALTILRAGQTLTIPAVPLPNDEGIGKIGINIGHPRLPISVGESLRGGVDAVRQQVVAILTLPGRLLAGTASPEEGRLVGYKGMLDMFSNMRELDQATEATVGGGVNTLGLIASISVSLAILNLFPVPALDGGRILFTLPELIIRRRLPMDLENVVNLIGFALLIGLLVYVNLQDFINPLELP
ncbi:MAG: site-2 protease family protein [Chloroflexi bacterium]|nr:site-2 protease family protein [Chloroflexota bacterium]